MPNREWVYSDASWNRIGVTLTEARIEWWESGQGAAGGGWCEQSFADFMVRGPSVENVPGEVLAELTEAVRALLVRGGADDTP